MKTEEREVKNQSFESLIENENHIPSMEIVERINEKTFPFNKNKFFMHVLIA